MRDRVLGFPRLGLKITGRGGEAKERGGGTGSHGVPRSGRKITRRRGEAKESGGGTRFCGVQRLGHKITRRDKVLRGSAFEAQNHQAGRGSKGERSRTGY